MLSPMLPLAAALALSTTVLASHASLRAPRSATKPNFVILMADDWGWGDLGANWPAAAGMTPHLDAIASSGVRFTDFHVAASVCSVSRAALLTGRLGVRTGVVTNFQIESVAGLPRSERTIAELLAPAGYRSGIIGKWHLGTTPGYHPSYRGFAHYLGLPYSVDMGCTDCPNWDKTGPRNCGKGGGPTPHQWELPLPLYRSTANCSGTGGPPDGGGSCNADIVQAPVNFSALSDNYASFATAFITNASNDNVPFFLYVPFSHVHTPQYGAPRNIGRSGRQGDAGHFYDSLLELDDTVGSIMAALKTSGVDDNTLVFVTGDNGPWEVKCNLSGSAGPYLGQWQKTHGGGGSSAKTTLWEGGHRVVGLARWPGKITPRVSSATVSSLDYLPTILALAGVPLPADRVYDGLDISKVLFNGDDTAGHTTLFHPNSGASGSISGRLDAVRWNNGSKQWKAVYQTGGAPGCGGVTGNATTHNPPLLFDLSTDPGETTALDVSQPLYSEVVAQIAAALKAQMHSVNTTLQSVVNYNTSFADEPCVHFADKSCRTGVPTPPPSPTPPPPSPPPPGPPPPPAPPGAGCNPANWFNGTIPWEKQEPRAPFAHPVTVGTPAECCALCVTNAGVGCAYWLWMSNSCYMKTEVQKCAPRTAAGVTCGTLKPWTE